jgi:hypothetical protein
MSLLQSCSIRLCGSAFSASSAVKYLLRDRGSDLTARCARARGKAPRKGEISALKTPQKSWRYNEFRMSRARFMVVRVSAALSLMLSAAAGVAWARSYNVLYSWSRFDIDRRSAGYFGDDVWLGTGRVLVSASRFPHSQLNPWIAPQGTGHWTLMRNPYWFANRGNYPLGWLVWSASLTHMPNGGRILQFGVNLGVLAIFLAIFPAVLRFKYLRKRYLVSHGRCTNCGYDLRATPGRCPECGMVPVKSYQRDVWGTSEYRG